MKSLLWHIGDACEYGSKPGARINAVQLCGLDHAVHARLGVHPLALTRTLPATITLGGA